MTAIAAVLAFSTPSFAQSAQEPIAYTSVPAPQVTPAPVAADPIAAEPIVADTPIVADPLAAEAAPAKPVARKATATKTATARSRPAPARTANAAPAVAAAPAAASIAPVAEAPAVEALPVQSEAAPVAAVEATPPAQDASASYAMLPIAGAAGLGLLGLIGVGMVMRRRKRRAEEAEFEARQTALAETEPTEAPVQADPLFAEHPSLPLAADPAPALAAAASTQSPIECVEAAPGSHVEAACEGPSADNPSLSIKKRLKRAHFFDQREFLVAAGEAVPVAADAGLSDAVEVPEPAPPAREPA